MSSSEGLATSAPTTPLLGASVAHAGSLNGTGGPQQQYSAMSSADAAARPPPTCKFTGDTALVQSGAWLWNGATTGGQVTSLTQRTLSLAIGAQATHLPLEDIIGVRAKGTDLLVHSYPRKGGCCTPGLAREYLLTRLSVRPDVGGQEASALVETWLSAFQQQLSAAWAAACSSDLEPRARSLLLLVNPASGAGNAASSLERLTPMLQQSGLNYRIAKTTHANHAFEMMRDMVLDSADAPTDVVCVSGDGLVHEVINGLMQRADWEEVVRRVRIGHIGGGSGNGLSSTVCAQAGEKMDPVSSMFLVLKGYTRPFDLFSIKQSGENIRYGMLSVGYGVVSDIDLESESFRYLGNARFTVSALTRICRLRRYHATLEFLVEEEANVEPGVNIAGPKCQAKDDGCDSCGHAPPSIQPTVNPQSEGRQALQSYLRSMEPPAALDEDGAATLSSIVVSSSSSSAPHAALQWQSLEDDFVMVWSMNVSHGASDMHVAPAAHFSDGYMDLYYIRAIGKCSLLSLFTSLETGTHSEHPAISSLKVRGFRITPRSDMRSELTSDGERLPYKPMEVRVHRGVINLLAR